MSDEAQEAANRQFRSAIEAAISSHGMQLVVLGRRINDLIVAARQDARQIGALERLVMATAVQGAQFVPDRLQYIDDIRRMALDAIPVDEEGTTDDMREPLEIALSKIEAALTGRG